MPEDICPVHKPIRNMLEQRIGVPCQGIVEVVAHDREDNIVNNGGLRVSENYWGVPAYTLILIRHDHIGAF